MQSAIRTSVLKMSAAVLTALSFAAVSAAQTHTVNVTIDASKTGAPISKYLYGQFLEHGGNIVNESSSTRSLRKSWNSPQGRVDGAARRYAIGRRLAATKW